MSAVVCYLRNGSPTGQGFALPLRPLHPERLAYVKPKAAAWRVLQARYATRGLTLDSDPQLDLGIDSLEWLNLGFELESVLGLRVA